MSQRQRTKVAIACQGGGSHTAFTAGVLKRLLADDGDEYNVVALTGTSGGAMCAFLAWYGLRTGDEEKATRLLRGFWNDVAANSLPERIVNDSFVASAKLRSNGYPVWEVSPSANPLAALGQTWLRSQLRKRIDAAPVEQLVGERTGDGSPVRPKLLVSAIDATDGSFGVFTDDVRPATNGEPVRDNSTASREGRSTSGVTGRAAERPSRADGNREPIGDAVQGRKPFDDEPRPLTLDAVMASAAVPTLFEPVEMPAEDGTRHAFWDGLLSQNPPIRNLLTGATEAARKPDEIWIVRIDPRSHRGSLDSLEAIEDRRTELAGNLSLHQELHFIDQVNEWLRKGVFTEEATQRYKHVTVRVIELDENRLRPPRELVTSTKLDRDPELIDGLVALGERQAAEFLSAKRSEQFTVVQ